MVPSVYGMLSTSINRALSSGLSGRAGKERGLELSGYRWLCKAMKRVHFQKIIFSDEAPRKRVHSEQPGSTSDCDVQERAAEETERQGGIGHSGSQKLGGEHV